MTSKKNLEKKELKGFRILAHAAEEVEHLIVSHEKQQQQQARISKENSRCDTKTKVILSPKLQENDASSTTSQLEVRNNKSQVEGCEKWPRTRGVCLRHGGKPKLCKIETCQTRFHEGCQGMCKGQFLQSTQHSTAASINTSTSRGPHVKTADTLALKRKHNAINDPLPIQENGNKPTITTLRGKPMTFNSTVRSSKQPRKEKESIEIEIKRPGIVASSDASGSSSLREEFEKNCRNSQAQIICAEKERASLVDQTAPEPHKNTRASLAQQQQKEMESIIEINEAVAPPPASNEKQDGIDGAIENQGNRIDRATEFILTVTTNSKTDAIDGTIQNQENETVPSTESVLMNSKAQVPKAQTALLSSEQKKDVIDESIQNYKRKKDLAVAQSPQKKARDENSEAKRRKIVASTDYSGLPLLLPPPSSSSLSGTQSEVSNRKTLFDPAKMVQKDVVFHSKRLGLKLNASGQNVVIVELMNTENANKIGVGDMMISVGGHKVEKMRKEEIAMVILNTTRPTTIRFLSTVK